MGTADGAAVEDITPLQEQQPFATAAPPSVQKSASSHKRTAESKLKDLRDTNLAEANQFLQELKLVGGDMFG